MSYFFRRKQLLKGDLPGHPFRGNQYVDAGGARSYEMSPSERAFLAVHGDHLDRKSGGKLSDSEAKDMERELRRHIDGPDPEITADQELTSRLERDMARTTVAEFTAEDRAHQAAIEDDFFERDDNPSPAAVRARYKEVFERELAREKLRDAAIAEYGSLDPDDYAQSATAAALRQGFTLDEITPPQHRKGARKQ